MVSPSPHDHLLNAKYSRFYKHVTRRLEGVVQIWRSEYDYIIEFPKYQLIQATLESQISQAFL